jgi:sec-independent protein translocase protein TatA
MPNIGAPELIVILVIALLILGPGKLPEVGASIGKSIREFRKASSDVSDSMKVDTTPLPPPTPSEVVAAPPPVAAPPSVEPPGAPTVPTTSSSGPRSSEPTPGTN